MNHSAPSQACTQLHAAVDMHIDNLFTSKTCSTLADNIAMDSIFLTIYHH